MLNEPLVNFLTVVFLCESFFDVSVSFLLSFFDNSGFDELKLLINNLFNVLYPFLLQIIIIFDILLSQVVHVALLQEVVSQQLNGRVRLILGLLVFNILFCGLVHFEHSFEVVIFLLCPFVMLIKRNHV